MESVKYAIVDIETTGGYSADDKIIELAVVLHDGKSIVDHFHTLVNPECPIPAFITGLTGIDAGLVKEAPVFSDIAGKLSELLTDKVFIAHNVNFDYHFVKEAFNKLNYEYNPSRLCTVRLSRQLFPGLRSYSLGSICENRRISISQRHRALGDALATAELFGQLLAADPSGLIHRSLNGTGRDMNLPPHISKEKYLGLPEATGVYYFHNQYGQVIYVGKAINIKKRFKSHFSGKSNIALKTEIHDVSFELTGSGFLALLLEALEIKRLWPKYNRSLKTKTFSWGIFPYEDIQGYLRFVVSKVNSGNVPACSFTSHQEAWTCMLHNIKKFQLCPKLSGIQSPSGACYDFQKNQCKGACCGKEEAEVYNGRAQTFLDQLRIEGTRILIREKGREKGEEAALFFENGYLAAFGFISRSIESEDHLAVLDTLTPVKQILETRYLLKAYLNETKGERIFHIP